MEKEKLIALDEAVVKQSVRDKDIDGFLHIATSNLTCDQVAPYYGREVPHWKEQGLDPDRIYYGWRNPDELQKALPTFNGVPLLIQHKFDSADKPNTELRVGMVGTSAKWQPPFITNALSVWDSDAVRAIEDGSLRDLSCGYRYEPDFTPGKTPDGLAYDFVMRDIKCNHVALVRDGRATDCYVADSKPQGIDMSDIQTNPQGGCDDFAAFVRQILESANLGLEPEKLDALVQAFVKGHDDHVKAQAQNAAPATTDDDPTPPADQPKSDDGTTDSDCDSGAQDQDDDKDDKPAASEGAQDAALIAKTIRDELRAQYQAASDVKDVLGAVEPMAYDSADDIYKAAIKSMGYKGEVPEGSAKVVFDALRAVKGTGKPDGAMDSKPADKPVSNAFLAKFIK